MCKFLENRVLCVNGLGIRDQGFKGQYIRGLDIRVNGLWIRVYGIRVKFA